jgi:asparaginyl-tRNA synthetase
MSHVTTIAEIGKHDGESVTIRGWLYNLRESGKLLFPQFRDGSGVIQGVVPKNAVTPEVFEAVKTLTQESSVVVEGKVRADKRAPGGYELDVANVQVVQRVTESDPYPITPKEHGTEFLMEHRHLWVRSQRQASILRVRAEIVKAVRDFFDERGFTLTDPPILTPAACEGTSTLFPVDYFEEQAYLTQSGQLYIEATAMALGKVYSFGPTFRAEKKDATPPHRILDGRAGNCLWRAQRPDESCRGVDHFRREAMPGAAARRLAVNWPRYFET